MCKSYFTIFIIKLKKKIKKLIVFIKKVLFYKNLLSKLHEFIMIRAEASLSRKDCRKVYRIKVLHY